MTTTFTGKERDTETGLDYFGARYYGSALGRFTSPDPFNAGTDPTDPQTWNGYAYVGNNPLGYIDPTGMAQVELTPDCTPERGCFSVTRDERRPWWQKLWSWIFGSSSGIAATIRPGNSAQYRAAWESEHGQPFPKDASGRNLDADHNMPISEGGDPFDGKNITPRTRADHIARHKAEGHYKKWGRQGANARAQARVAGQQSEPTPGQATDEMPELPTIPRPFVPGLDPDPPIVLPTPSAPGVPEGVEIPEIEIGPL